MFDDLIKAISLNLSEIRSQQSKQSIQIKVGFQLVEQLRSSIDKKFSLEVKGNIVTRNQFEEFSEKSLEYNDVAQPPFTKLFARRDHELAYVKDSLFET